MPSSFGFRAQFDEFPSFSADMPWPRGPEDELLSGLLVLPSLPMDSWRCDEGTAL